MWGMWMVLSSFDVSVRFSALTSQTTSQKGETDVVGVFLTERDVGPRRASGLGLR